MSLGVDGKDFTSACELVDFGFQKRQCRDIQIPKDRTEFAKIGFGYTAIKILNNSPAKSKFIR